jgi:hypothetical protein
MTPVIKEDAQYGSCAGGTMQRVTDEDVLPERELRVFLDGTIGAGHYELALRARKGRGERVTLIMPDKSRVSLAADSRKAGVSRLMLKKFIEDLVSVIRKSIEGPGLEP